MFPTRSSWPKNIKGGFRVSPYAVKRKRHEGVRCYGVHVGSKCHPFDFSGCPSIQQAVYVPTWVGIVAKLAQSTAREIARVRYYNLDKQAA